jgi:predicted alpha/beta hydrolase family esterase
MRRSVLIIPDSVESGDPKEKWYHPYKERLKAAGHLAWVASKAPDADAFTAEEWLTTRPGKGYREFFGGKDSALVGHGLGGNVALRFLEQAEEEDAIGDLVLVATPIGVEPISNPQLAEFSGGTDYDWDTIRERAGTITIIHAIHDPDVAVANATELQRQLLGAIGPVSQVGQHFSSAEGIDSPLHLLPTFD